MRSLFIVPIFILLTVSGHAQQNSSPKCELQQLAIDAALGDIDAQFDLGVEFFRGLSIPRDYSKAAKMWQLASTAGRIEATNNLGFLKYHGRVGVKQDKAEGIRLWRLAAEQGYPESQVHLGGAYADESYLIQDLLEAYAWAKAGKHHAQQTKSAGTDKLGTADGVVKMAEQLLADVRKRLSEIQLADAEKKAAEYIVKYYPR